MMPNNHLWYWICSKILEWSFLQYIIRIVLFWGPHLPSFFCADPSLEYPCCLITHVFLRIHILHFCYHHFSNIVGDSLKSTLKMSFLYSVRPQKSYPKGSSFPSKNEKTFKNLFRWQWEGNKFSQQFFMITIS